MAFSLILDRKFLFSLLFSERLSFQGVFLVSIRLSALQASLSNSMWVLSSSWSQDVNSFGFFFLFSFRSNDATYMQRVFLATLRFSLLLSVSLVRLQVTVDVKHKEDFFVLYMSFKQMDLKIERQDHLLRFNIAQISCFSA